MIVEQLELVHYRSYTNLKVRFQKGLNIFLGKNGAGKTNLVEAIHYLSLARSFRTSNDKELIQKGKIFANIKATIEQDDIRRVLDITIRDSGKQIILQKKPVMKLSQLAQVMNVLVFEPRDVLIFDELPKVRRQFLDVTLSKHSRHYLEHISRYEAVLKQRNDLLKHNVVDIAHLDILTNQLIQASYPIIIARMTYLKEVNEVIGKITQSIKGDAFPIQLQYVPFIKDMKVYQEEAKKQYRDSRALDLKRKVTQIGVHREDFVVIYHNHAIQSFGSQGENRLAAMALKLSPYFLIKDKNQRPVIVLDDVLSEFDTPTQQRVLLFLEKLQQVFITTTQVPSKQYPIYEIQQNQVTRRTS
jgi:DNA replication and repair protein RecF